jgi:hypothetical protein
LPVIFAGFISDCAERSMGTSASAQPDPSHVNFCITFIANLLGDPAVDDAAGIATQRAGR